MNNRYRVFRRGWGTYYCEDLVTKKQQSLHTRDKDEAYRLVAAKNETEKLPAFSLHLARVYWKAGDPAAGTRTWQTVMDELVKLKRNANQRRWLTAIEDKAFDSVRNLPILETRSEHFLKVLHQGSVSTNNYLRRLHNFALDMSWLPWPVLPKRQWPPIRYKEKRAVTQAEHELIVSRETNAEMKSFLWCCWHLGGAQSDVAHLEAKHIDWASRVVSFFRSKTGRAQIIHFGAGLAEVLQGLPQDGLLFPRLAGMDEKHRASLFQRACRRVKIKGVSLHSYRYAWAERAKIAGYPERFAQEALGHNSKAVHRAYAKKAQVILPALEDFEKKIIQFNGAKAAEATVAQAEQAVEA
ncbi:MAG TPA: tyrosine-type recombinase/integrase [Candidatus Acidoferrum sp.]|nr:tyrosine-type recombinase/integrase [Candidatus Acidoferrum sp.]